MTNTITHPTETPYRRSPLNAAADRVEAIYPATPVAVTEARRALASYARELGASEGTVEAVRLAVSEALTNAIVHGYRGSAGLIRITAAVAGDELWVLVTDGGCGHQNPPCSPGLGWGLALIADCSDGFTITERSGGGTEIQMCFRLPASDGPERLADRL